MNVVNILWRNLKWFMQNPITIGLTIVQPLIWLVLYSAIAAQTMDGPAGGNYTAFILPGILVLVIFSSSGSSGMLNYIMKTSGSFYRIKIAPVQRSAIVLGYILGNVLLSLGEVAILSGIAFFLSVQMAAGFGGLLLMVVLLCFAAFFMAGLSYALSLCLPNEVVFETVMNTVVLPIFFVSTALFPLDHISGGLRVAVMLNPFNHIINSLRGLLLESSINWRDLLFTMGLFLVLCCLSFMLAVWNLKRDSQQ